MAEKRIVNETAATGLRSINNLILVGIMMAVGVVLRLCAGFLALGNMHPNFLIATYCLSILIVRPNFKEAAIIGFISGAISQIGTSMPWLGLLSETLGADWADQLVDWGDVPALASADLGSYDTAADGSASQSVQELLSPCKIAVLDASDGLWAALTAGEG